MKDRRIAFLDRDGVLTVPREQDSKGYAPRSVAELDFYADAADSVLRLKSAGFDAVIVTNQPDVASGLLTRKSLDEIHEVVRNRLEIDSIRTCPHASKDACSCRKPLPGLLLENDQLGPVDYASSWMIGDRDSDVQAGSAAGCRTVFIHRGWTAETGSGADVVVRSLMEAVDTILATQHSDGGWWTRDSQHQDLH